MEMQETAQVWAAQDDLRGSWRDASLRTHGCRAASLPQMALYSYYGRSPSL